MVKLLRLVARTFWCRDVEQVLADPVLGPAFFNNGRIVCFWQLVTHVL